jgi:hypothetical protein
LHSSEASVEADDTSGDEAQLWRSYRNGCSKTIRRSAGPWRLGQRTPRATGLARQPPRSGARSYLPASR